MKSPRIFPSRAAFTLIELLVVLAIVAVLAGISYAGLSVAARNGRRTQCLSNMRQIGAAAISYSSDNNNDFPMADNPAWDVPLNPYLGEQNTVLANPIYKCPEDTRPLSGVNKQFARSYSFNGKLPGKSILLDTPAQTIMLAEWYSGASGPGGATHNYQYGGSFDAVVYSRNAVPHPDKQPGYHGAQSNFVLADGHAEVLDPTMTVASVPSMWDTTR